MIHRRITDSERGPLYARVFHSIRALCIALFIPHCILCHRPIMADTYDSHKPCREALGVKCPVSTL